MLRRWLARYPKQELYHWGLAHGATLAPVNTLPELLELEHLQRRDYWIEPVGAGADVMRRIAAPMVGGLATSFLLELTVYPALFAVWKGASIKIRKNQ